MSKKNNEEVMRNFGEMTEEEAKVVIFNEGYTNLKKGTIQGFVKQYHADEGIEWLKDAFQFKETYTLVMDETKGKKVKKASGVKSKRATFDNVTGRKLFWKHFEMKALKKEEKELSIEDAMAQFLGA